MELRLNDLLFILILLDICTILVQDQAGWGAGLVQGVTAHDRGFELDEL